MRVVYEQTFCEQLDNKIFGAVASCKSIKHIVITKEEALKLYNETHPYRILAVATTSWPPAESSLKEAKELAIHNSKYGGVLIKVEGYE